MFFDHLCWQEEEGEMGRVVEVSPEEQECRHTIHSLLERYRWSWCVEFLKDVSLKRYMQG